MTERCLGRNRLPLGEFMQSFRVYARMVLSPAKAGLSLVREGAAAARLGDYKLARASNSEAPADWGLFSCLCHFHTILRAGKSLSAILTPAFDRQKW